tara:strand:+ start:2506 stop:2772 length:267 start_codon:yes stop_codon:yes gene_type:complete
LAHDRVAAQPVGVVDVLIPSHAREDRLPQQARERVTAILAGAVIDQHSGRQIGQPGRVVELAIDRPASIGTDRRGAKQQPNRPVKFQP